MRPWFATPLLALSLAAPAGRHPDSRLQTPGAVTPKNRQSLAQRKINSQLLDAVQRQSGKTTGLPTEPAPVDIDGKGRALVDIRADVSERLLKLIRRSGGEIVETSAEHRSILVRIPLDKLEGLAADDDIRFIEPAARPMTNQKKEAM